MTHRPISMTARRLVSLALLLALAISALPPTFKRAGARPLDTNIALGGTASASSTENAGTPASAAIDGNLGTRWASAWDDDEYLQVDLGANASISQVKISWEWANSYEYEVLVSSDEVNWTSVVSRTGVAQTGPRTDDWPSLTASGRYVRVHCIKRSSIYGNSIYELEIYGVLDVQTVSLDGALVSVDEGDQLELPVRLNKAAASPITVDYETIAATASTGLDYTPLSGTLTFDPGTTVLTLTLDTLQDEIDEPTEALSVTLSNATAGVSIMPRASTLVRIMDDDVAEYNGAVMVVDSFEPGEQPPMGNPYGLFTFGETAGDNPTLTFPQLDRPTATVTPNHVMDVDYNRTGGWGGYSRNLPENGSQDWSDFSGIAFWFKGSATGHTIQFEIKDGGPHGEVSELWETFITDSSSDWRLIRVPFGDFVLRTSYQPGGNPIDSVLNLVQMWGYAMNLPQGDGRFQLDDVHVYEAAITIEDFEGPVDFGDAQSNPVGWFSFGETVADRPILTVVESVRPGAPITPNHALSVTVDINGAYGGVVHNLSDPQDWSAFKGFRFWYYGTNETLPTAPGPRIYVEIKDGGAHGEASELWNTSFLDNYVGWTLIEIPFSQFKFRTDWQPLGSNGIDKVLNLKEMWGYAFTPPPGMEDVFLLDDTQVYGVAGAAATASAGTAAPVYLADEGDSVAVGVKVTTVSGDPLEDEVVVDYSTEAVSPTTVADFTPISGTLTFPAGTPSGTVMSFTVQIASDATPEVAELIDIVLETGGVGAGIAEDAGTIVINAHGLPYLNASLPIAQRVADLLARMTVEEKVGQMTQAERGALDEQDDIATWRLGSLLSGGGSTPAVNNPASWADMVDAFQLRAMQTPLQIPLIYGVDAVHGHNNVRGATIFPHNIGLGATRTPGLVQQVGAITAKEVRATGIPWTFAPCLCVTRDERWGRSYESFGEDPALVSKMTTIITGLQGTGTQLAGNQKVLATAKHFVGDGGTTYDSSTTGGYTIDQGITELTEADLRRLHLAPYIPAIQKGVGSIMPSYSSVDLLDDAEGPIKMHAHKYLLTDVLKGELGFEGFLISDWAGIDQIPGSYTTDVSTSITAGLDMIMVPYDYQLFETTLLAEVAAGRVPMSRIDDAVSRILTQKFKLGLFEKPFTDRTHLAAVGSPAHRDVARKAVVKSQVLLKNKGGLLPLSRGGNIYLAGSNADDLGNQAGGWTISWQGSSGNITTGTTIRQAIAQVAPNATVTYSRDASAPTAGHAVGIVVVGETPYAEGVGDVGNGRADLSLSTADRQAIDTVCDAMDCVVIIVSGRPMLIEDKLAKIDALVAAWLPGTEGLGVAQPLFGLQPYTGRLPVTWPRNMAQLPINVGDATYDPLYPFGWGLRTDPARARLRNTRNSLTAFQSNAHVKSAIGLLDQALQERFWNANGSARNSLELLGLLRNAARHLQQVPNVRVAQHTDTVVSVARDVAQGAIARAPLGPDRVLDVKRSAAAERQLLTGNAERAVILLTQAAQ